MPLALTLVLTTALALAFPLVRTLSLDLVLTRLGYLVSTVGQAYRLEEILLQAILRDSIALRAKYGRRGSKEIQLGQLACWILAASVLSLYLDKDEELD